MKPLTNFLETMQILKDIALTSVMIEDRDDPRIVYTSETKEEAERDYIMAFQLMQFSKVFEVSPNVVKLLINTDNNIAPTRLPFSPMWIECRVSLDDVWIITPEEAEARKLSPLKARQQYLGFLLVEGGTLENTPFENFSHLVVDSKKLTEQGYPNIYILTVTQDEAGYGHVKISLYSDYRETTHGTLNDSWARERDFIRLFVMNFLDFLNDPEVEYHEVLRTDRSVRKAKKLGKKPKYEIKSNVITVNGKLKIYMDNYEKGLERREYHCKFWVRGHWRHMVSSYYKSKRGMKVWIPPYVKGQGILVNKDYKLDRKILDTPEATVEVSGVSN